jgi:hypothetical protein
LTLNTYSIARDAVVPGTGCTAQGILINIGDVASAWWTLVIAVHTFLVLAGRAQWRSWAAEKSVKGKSRWFLLGGVWSGSIFLSTFGLAIQNYYPDNGPYCELLRCLSLTLDNNAGPGWCWIGDSYFWERIFMHYSNSLIFLILKSVFLFFNGFALPVLYCLLFLYIRGHLKAFRISISSKQSGGLELKPWQKNLESGCSGIIASPRQVIKTKSMTIQQPREHNEAERGARRMNQVAIILLYYPIAYLCLTVPISVVRVATYSGAQFSLPVSYVVVSIYASSGWVNVLLYTIPRKGIISWDRLLLCSQNTTKDDQSEPLRLALPANSEFSKSSQARQDPYNSSDNSDHHELCPPSPGVPKLIHIRSKACYPTSSNVSGSSTIFPDV